MGQANESDDLCPGCGHVGGAGQGSCPECGFPVSTCQSLRQAVGDSRPDPRQESAREPIEFQNAGASIAVGDSAGVIVGRVGDPLQVASLAGISALGITAHAVRHRRLQERHVAIVRGESESFWVIDLSLDQSCVFVDGRRANLTKLVDAAVLQIGPLAWQWNVAKRMLIPVTPIGGFDLQVDAEVAGRLKRTQLSIDRGAMTALVGPSGCGKSTLLETIRDGSGLAGEIETAGRVFFVPQRDLVHHDLKLGDALLAIGRLYRKEVLPFEIDAALDSVGLPASAKDKFPSELSGGQLRRFRIAGALLSGAGVIVLDEPDSGLDHETADEVISLLHSLAVRGATIVAVTHHRHVLEYFDRVIRMRPTGDGGEIDTQALPSPPEGSAAGQSSDDEAVDGSAADEQGPDLIGRVSRLTTLLRRERKKLTSPVLSRIALGPLRVRRFVVDLLLVPLLFAVAVAISVPTDPDRDVADGLYGQMAPIARLGFMAVISVIWMSASCSHLSVTRDREVYDYERSFGLSWAAVLSAKSIVLSLAGILQTIVFAGLLYGIRNVWLERSFFIDERATQLPSVLLVLLAVSVAASMTGLLVSCVAGRAPLMATAILPVVMMFQILFSAPFAVSDPDGYEPLVDYAQLTVLSEEQMSGEDGDDDSDWEDDWEDDMDQQKPLWVTSLFSYGTLSRYGDKWIRSFAVTIDPPENAASVQRASAAALALISGLCFVASWFVLWMQSTRLGIRRVATRRVATRPAVTVAMVLVAMWLGSAMPIAVADEPAAHQQKHHQPEIRLPIVDGRYDENQLRAAMGGQAGMPPRWREFSNQDRIGLVALELVGKIEFELTDRQLAIRLKQMPKWELMKQLAPPRLIGVESIGGGEDGVGEDNDRQRGGNRDVVLFVHGLEGGGATFASAAETLSQRGIAALRFDYPNDGPPDQIGRHLAEQLIELADQHPGLRVHLVAHSLGGLVATWAVTESDFPAEIVPHVITLGTPFRGSELASFHDELELFDVVYRLATGTPGALDTIADGRGEAAVALDPDSDFLRRLHARKRPPGIRFHLAAGTRSFLTESRRDALATQLPGELARLGVSETYARRIERLLAADELRDGLGDGAVTVRSALGLQNAASRRTFSLTHTALVSSEGPLEWVLSVVGRGEPAKQLAK